MGCLRLPPRPHCVISTEAGRESCAAERPATPCHHHRPHPPGGPSFRSPIAKGWVAFAFLPTHTVSSPAKQDASPAQRRDPQHTMPPPPPASAGWPILSQPHAKGWVAFVSLPAHTVSSRPKQDASPAQRRDPQHHATTTARVRRVAHPFAASSRKDGLPSSSHPETYGCHSEAQPKNPRIASRAADRVRPCTQTPPSPKTTH
jgi:hypothetical protein